MKGVCVVSLLAFSLAPVSSAFAVPAPDLNQQLLSAVCSNNWRGAVRVVDAMKAVSPGDRLPELNAYRSQLVAIADSGASFSSPACSASSRSRSSRSSGSPGFSSQSPDSGASRSLQDYSDALRSR